MEVYYLEVSSEVTEVSFDVSIKVLRGTATSIGD
jgi:hypothetical protein